MKTASTVKAPKTFTEADKCCFAYEKTWNWLLTVGRSQRFFFLWPLDHLDLLNYDILRNGMALQRLDKEMRLLLVCHWTFKDLDFIE